MYVELKFRSCVLFPLSLTREDQFYDSVIMERSILPLIVDSGAPSTAVVEKLVTWQEHVHRNSKKRVM